MTRLAEIYYLIGDLENEYPTKDQMEMISRKEDELYNQLNELLNDDQLKIFNEFTDVLIQRYGMQEHIVVSKAVALGMQISSEAFLTELGVMR